MWSSRGGSLSALRDGFRQAGLTFAIFCTKVHDRVLTPSPPLAVGHVVAHAFRWWLHIDLDVLARSDFAACGAPGEVPLADGRTWQQLTEIAASALRGGCAGWSPTIYNPDLDPDGSATRRIVKFVTQVAPFGRR